jgi:hypothetical protein
MLCQRATPLTALSPLQRERCARLPRHDLVDAELGRRLHRELVAVAFASAWASTRRGLGGAATVRAVTVTATRLGADAATTPVSQTPTVADRHLLADADATHDRRMMSLGTGDDLVARSGVGDGGPSPTARRRVQRHLSRGTGRAASRTCPGGTAPGGGGAFVRLAKSSMSARSLASSFVGVTTCTPTRRSPRVPPRRA